MGQEKSVPSRNCNKKYQTHRFANINPTSYSPNVGHGAVYSTSTSTSTSTPAAADYNNNTGKSSHRTSTTSCKSSTTDRSTQTVSSVSTATSKSNKHQTKYLNEHLYINSYLDIEDDKRKNKRFLNEQTRAGLRNYTPKILSREKSDLEVWVSLKE